MKPEPIDTYITREIRKAMIDADVTYDQIGEGTGRAWRNRINNPYRMNGEQYFYLCQRLRQNPSESINNKRQLQEVST